MSMSLLKKLKNVIVWNYFYHGSKLGSSYSLCDLNSSTFIQDFVDTINNTLLDKSISSQLNSRIFKTFEDVIFHSLIQAYSENDIEASINIFENNTEKSKNVKCNAEIQVYLSHHSHS